MEKVKIIISAIIGAVLFIIGILAGRAGRHNESGIDSAIDGEGEHEGNLNSAESRERDTQDRIDIVTSGVNATAAGISDLETGIADTDRLVERIKKRNGIK